MIIFSLGIGVGSELKEKYVRRVYEENITGVRWDLY
jgi:hypothetical protein